MEALNALSYIKAKAIYDEEQQRKHGKKSSEY
jgi:hypothetical protein